MMSSLWGMLGIGTLDADPVNTTDIVIAQGLCSAIRPKVLTAFPPDKYPGIKITAWGEGHWHMPVPDTMPMPDDDPWVKKHIARVSVEGDLSFAIWCEYVLCRLIQSTPDAWLYLMSVPLEPRNQKWAAQWDTLPDGWRERGCGEWKRLQAERSATQAPTVQRRGKRKPATTQRAPRAQHAGVLNALSKFFW